MFEKYKKGVDWCGTRKRFWARFQDECKKNLSSNQLTIMIAEKIPEDKEPENFAIPEIPEEQVKLEKGYY